MRTTVVTGLSLLGLLGLSACGSGEPERPRSGETPATGLPLVVRDTQIDAVLELAGTAAPVRRATIASRLMAAVEAVPVQEGDRVAAGALLVRLDARDLDARARQVDASTAEANAMLGQARPMAVRMRSLYADSAATRAQLEGAEATLARAEAALRAAAAAGAEVSAQRPYASLRAPFAGVVTARHVDPGALAAPGVPLVAIEDQSRLRATATAAPEALARLRRGDTITVRFGEREIPGRVEGVVPAGTGNLSAVNVIVENRGLGLGSGAAVTIAVPQGRRAGVIVPADALVREGDLAGVVVRRGGVDGRVWVRTGNRIGSGVEILSGIAPGDTIVVPGGP